MPEGFEPGLSVSHIMQVPSGGTLPTPDGRVQMYPCHSFEFHLVLMSIDPDLGRPEIRRYTIGHDCGIVINPKIVRGMTMGGVAHGIGAALLEEFAYDGEGQMVAQSFMDYLLPSAHEVPPVHIVASRDALAADRARAEGLRRSPAISARRRRSPMRSTMRCGRSASRSNTLPLKISKIADAVAAAREQQGI